MTSRLQSSARDAKPRRQALVDLLERVKGAEGADRELDADLTTALRPEEAPYVRYGVDFGEAGRIRPWVPTYTTSLDTVLALVERRLPGWRRSITERASNAWEAVVAHNFAGRTDAGPHEVRVGNGSTPARALIASLLTALLSQEEDA